MIPFPSVPTKEGFATAVPSDPERIKPGADPYLDFVCDRILDGAEFVLPDALAVRGFYPRRRWSRGRPGPREPGNGVDRRPARTWCGGGRADTRADRACSEVGNGRRRRHGQLSAAARGFVNDGSGRRIPRCGRPARRRRAGCRRHEVRARLSQACLPSGTSPLARSRTLSSLWPYRPEEEERGPTIPARARCALPLCDRGCRTRSVCRGRPTGRGRGPSRRPNHSRRCC